MKTISAFIAIIIGLFIAFAMVYGGYLAVKYVWLLYSSLDFVIRIVLFSVMATLIVVSMIILASINSAMKSHQHTQLIESKLELYKILINILRLYITDTKQKSNQEATEVLSRLNNIESELNIIASSTVLISYQKLVSCIHNTHDTEKQTVYLQQLVKAIRRDLGHGINYDETKLSIIFNKSNHNY